MQPVPYYMKPGDTKLGEGPDPSLDPDVAPVDAERRGVAPFVWPLVDRSRGPRGPLDGPLGPGGVDPARRGVPASSWPRIEAHNCPQAELVSPIPDLDPDIALWPVTILSRWPFTGPPSVGTWPKGWVGVDNTAQPYVCTVAGSPGTWAPIGFTSAGVASFNTRTGAVTLQVGDVESVFTQDDQVMIGTGSGTAELLNLGAARVYLSGGGTLTAGTPETIVFNNTDYQIGSVTAGAAIVIGTSGLFEVHAQVYVANNAGITRYTAQVLQNATPVLQGDGASNGAFVSIKMDGTLKLNAADDITVVATVTGANGTLVASGALSALTYLSVAQIPSTTS